jgi:hypothetical protein
MRAFSKSIVTTFGASLFYFFNYFDYFNQRFDAVIQADRWL